MSTSSGHAKPSGLLDSIVARTREQQAQLLARAEQHSKDASEAAKGVSADAADDLNAEIQLIYDTQKQIEHETQLLRQEINDFNTHVATWNSRAQRLSESLKSIGDIEQYAAVIAQRANAALSNCFTTPASSLAPTPSPGPSSRPSPTPGQQPSSPAAGGTHHTAASNSSSSDSPGVALPPPSLGSLPVSRRASS